MFTNIDFLEVRHLKNSSSTLCLDTPRPTLIKNLIQATIQATYIIFKFTSRHIGKFFKRQI